MNAKTYLLGAILATFIFTIMPAQDSSSIQNSLSSQNQQVATQFTITKNNGLTEFIVVNCKEKAKEDLYQKTTEWINKTYNKPGEVIKASVYNNYIRFQGVSKDKYCWTNLMSFCNDIRYEIEVSFKDGKYKFEILELEHYAVTGASGHRVWSKVNYKDSWTHFKKDGEVRKMYVDNIKNIAGYFNNLNNDLYDYIYNQNEAAKQNDW
ncbi:DUF4468 domain-containing protein [Chryseobacterium sp.]|uniref:DUF4468 domain-containing protein n=1 Tax=Chryseobacterium sp. TaxID=1871047 RepID=UPI0024E19C7B|nr:DUF4468 domain-containing protein [Chryseobacterium sp.]